MRSSCRRVVTLCAFERLIFWMCPHVFLESTGLCARVLALCTKERFFSCMSPHVYLENRSTFARVVTLCAVEWFSLWMGEHVCLKVTSLCKWVVALSAIVRFFPHMFSLVCLQSTSLGAREFAQCATKRFFSWMGPHVYLEIKSSFARVVALFANEKLFAITLRLTDISWCVDSLHFCDRPSTKVEGQLIAKLVTIFGEGQWKVKVITYRHTSPLLILYHLIPSSANLYWTNTGQYCHILTQYHQVALIIHHLARHSSANWIISLFTTHLMSHAHHTWSSFYLSSKTWKRRDFSSVHSRFQFSRRACPVRRRLSLDQTDNCGVMIRTRFKDIIFLIMSDDQMEV